MDNAGSNPMHTKNSSAMFFQHRHAATRSMSVTPIINGVSRSNTANPGNRTRNNHNNMHSQQSPMNNLL